MLNPNREYSDELCTSMGAAYDQAFKITPHMALFPELGKLIAEHILSDSDRGVSQKEELCANALSAFGAEGE
jgi:hypothetical protein